MQISSYTRLFRNNQHCLNDAIVRSSVSANLVVGNGLNIERLLTWVRSEASIVFIQKSKQNKQEFKTGLFDVILDNVVAASAQLDPTPQILISTIHRQHF